MHEFEWQWNDGPMWPDPIMTRQRAARLLRSWRRSARQPANYKNVISCTRIAPGCYRVISSHDETGTMVINRKTAVMIDALSGERK